MIGAARAAFAQMEARTPPVVFQRAQKLALAYYYAITKSFPPPDSTLLCDASSGVCLLFRPDVPYPQTPPRRGGRARNSVPVLEDWTYPDIESFVEASTGELPSVTFSEFVEEVEARGAHAQVEATWNRYISSYDSPPPAKKQRTADDDVPVLKARIEELQQTLQKALADMDNTIKERDNAIKERDVAMRQVQVAIHGLASNTSANMSPPAWRPPPPKMNTPPFARSGLGGGARRALSMSSPPLMHMPHVIQHNKLVGELRGLGCLDEGEQQRVMSLLHQHKDAIRGMCVSHGVAKADAVTSWTLEKAALELCRCIQRQSLGMA